MNQANKHAIYKALLENDKTYDYLCEINNIYPGDRVEVPDWEGKGKATVTDVKMVEISKLELPVVKYKKVIEVVKKENPRKD